MDTLMHDKIRHHLSALDPTINPPLPSPDFEDLSSLNSSSYSSSHSSGNDYFNETPADSHYGQHCGNNQVPMTTTVAYQCPGDSNHVTVDNSTVIDGVVVTEQRRLGKILGIAVSVFSIILLLMGAILATLILTGYIRPEPSHQPSLVPTLSSSPTTAFDYERLVKGIAMQISEEEIVNDQSSIQYMTYKTIAGNLPLLLEKGLIELNDTDAIAQRYILGVTYASLSTEEKRRQPVLNIQAFLTPICDLVYCTCNNNAEMIGLSVQNLISVTGGGGILASEIGALPELRQILFARNGIVSTIPSEIGNLKHLRTLDLRGNAFTGSIPTTIGKLKSLELLDVSNNMLDGSIPSEIGGLDSLKYLDLSQNGLVGDIPLELHTLMSIETLKLRNNSLTGNLEYFCNRSSSVVGEGEETIIEGVIDILSYVFEPAYELDCNDDGE